VIASWKLESGSERKVFFFEKKKQKTFACLAAASPERLGPDSQKFFGSFFQKRTASLIAVARIGAA
jgi:hypothetical protein